MTAMKSPGAVAALGASKNDQLSSEVISEVSPHKKLNPAIRAELNGSNRCSTLGITARGHSPVLGLCRKLIEARYDPATSVEVYRDQTLCLRVRSIGEATAIRIASHGVGFEPLPKCTAAAPMLKNETAHIQRHSR